MTLTHCTVPCGFSVLDGMFTYHLHNIENNFFSLGLVPTIIISIKEHKRSLSFITYFHREQIGVY